MRPIILVNQKMAHSRPEHLPRILCFTITDFTPEILLQ